MTAFPALDFLCHPLPRLCREPETVQCLMPACPLLFGEKEVKQHTGLGFSLLAGHRRAAPAGEGVIFSLSVCITQSLETFLLSHVNHHLLVLFWKAPSSQVPFPETERQSH